MHNTEQHSILGTICQRNPVKGFPQWKMNRMTESLEVKSWRGMGKELVILKHLEKGKKIKWAARTLRTSRIDI